MSAFKNEFSWSITRDRVFQSCPRQYYYNYYGYWGGWEMDAPERTRQTYILKNLKNRFMWAGEKVHDCIKHTLTNLRRDISILDVDQIISITLNQMWRVQVFQGKTLSYPSKDLRSFWTRIWRGHIGCWLEKSCG